MKFHMTQLWEHSPADWRRWSKCQALYLQEFVPWEVTRLLLSRLDRMNLWWSPETAKVLTKNIHKLFPVTDFVAVVVVVVARWTNTNAKSQKAVGNEKGKEGRERADDLLFKDSNLSRLYSEAYSFIGWWIKFRVWVKLTTRIDVGKDETITKLFVPQTSNNVNCENFAKTFEGW